MPVGAASAMRRSSPRASACSTSATRRPATAVVLPVPGPPVMTVVDWVAARRQACALLVGRTVGEDTRQGLLEQVGVDDADVALARLQVVEHLRLLLVVAVEVEQPVLPVERHRPRGAGSARRPPTTPRAPARGGRGRPATPRRVPSSRHTDPWRTARTASATASRTLALGLAAEPAEVGGDVDVGGGQHAGRVEGGQGAGRPQREVAVVDVDRLEHLAHDATTRPSSRSESSSTRATGGRHEKIPQGSPSTRGVAGPHMPRR